MIPPTKVAVCIATYQRPLMLRSLLASLQALRFEKVLEPDLSIVVIDNDPLGSAQLIVAEFLSRRLPIRYRREPRKGISFARNAAIEQSRSADFIAFLDDDEQASPVWLDELLTVQAAYNAAIVAGPVLPRFESSPPALLSHNPFVRRPRHATGTPLLSVGAGNVLISSKVLRTLAPNWFDSRYGTTGGEDTQFFRRCALHGFQIIWADDAVVHEVVSVSRLTPEYLARRARSGANQWTRVELELRPTLAHMGFRFGVGVFRLLQGTLMGAAAPVLSSRHQLRGRMLVAEGIGNLNAFFGRKYEQYGGESS